MFVEVTRDDFSHQTLYDRLRTETAGRAGAVVTFTGLVRNSNAEHQVEAIELEQYEGMTHNVMAELATKAINRFALISAGLVHRIGRIESGQQIVWVGVASPHRQAAFEAGCFLMDNLKQSVPLWKKEWRNGKAHWVVAKASDKSAAQMWQEG